MQKINHIFSLKQWEQVQDSLSDLTGMAVLMVDYRGVPVTKHSHCCEFCRKVRESPVLKKYCEKCDSHGGAEAVRENRPYIYRCCFGLIDIAIPILSQDTYLGALMIGQVKTEGEKLESIVTLPDNMEIQKQLKGLQSDYESIPVLDFSEIRRSSDMLYQLCHYIVEREKKNDFNETIEVEIKESPGLITNENRVVMRAKEYVREHIESEVSLTETAKSCHISAGYLSRLFMKETGESFSCFVSEEKTEKAKEWLEAGEMSVSEVGERLGFSETGYFIRIFKRNVGMTPGKYRQYRKCTR